MTSPLRPPDDYDPFAEFDLFAGVGTVRDPFPVWAELLGECPVHAGSLADRFGVAPFGEAMTEDTVTPHQSSASTPCSRSCATATTFTSSGYDETIGLRLRSLDPRDGRARAPLRTARSSSRRSRARRWRSWEADIVRPVVDDLVDAFRDRGHADLVKRAAVPVPGDGHRGDDRAPRRRPPGRSTARRVELITIINNIERGYNASLWLYDYFQKIIVERRADPRKDLISVLVQAELDGQQPHQRRDHRVPPPAAPRGRRDHVPLVEQPDVRAADATPTSSRPCATTATLMPQAIEEGVRWEPPLTSIGRTAARDVEVDGVMIPKGSPVSVCMASANRDPSRWDEPGRVRHLP